MRTAGAADYLEAIQNGHSDIEDCDIRGQLAYQLHRLATIRGLADKLEITLVPDRLLQRTPEQWMIIGHHDSNSRTYGSHAKSLASVG
nr:hypothetical protein [Cryobacterium sp. M23]